MRCALADTLVDDVVGKGGPVVLRRGEALGTGCEVFCCLSAQPTVVFGDGSPLLEGLDVDNTFDDYFAQYRSLNWESSFQVDKRLRLFLNVNNLTDEPQVSYQGFQRTDNPEDVTTYSWRATAGATYRF